jgi:hypothetical protein
MKPLLAGSLCNVHGLTFPADSFTGHVGTCLLMGIGIYYALCHRKELGEMLCQYASEVTDCADNKGGT